MAVADPVMLATVRQARGLTQSEPARMAGLSQAFVSKAEAGRAELPPTSSTMKSRVTLPLLSVNVSATVQFPGVEHDTTGAYIVKSPAATGMPTAWPHVPCDSVATNVRRASTAWLGSWRRGLGGMSLAG